MNSPTGPETPATAPEYGHSFLVDETGPQEPIEAELTEAETASSSAPLGGWYDIVRSGGVKFIALGVSAVLGIIITRLIITNYGTDVFAQYGLLVGLASLLPINALGIGAPLVNAAAVSENPGKDDELRRVILTSLRILVAASIVLLGFVAIMSIFNLWEPVLGASLLPGTGTIAAAACMTLWAIGMPFGIGHRLMAGRGLNHITIAIDGLQSPIVLLVLLLTLGHDQRTGSYIPVVAYAATLLIAIICCIVAARILRPTLTTAVRQIPFRQRFPGAKILDQAIPMTIIMVALPISFQTDRLILSHVATPAALAEYNLGAQMFTPIFALVSAAGFTLWPRFAANRSQDKDESPTRLSLFFGGIAAILCIGMMVFSPLLAKFASGGEITLGLGILLAFSLLMTFQALQYPMGMYLTDVPGLRFQALMVTLMLPVNLALSLWLASVIGAAGPVLGSAISVGLFQVVANGVFVRRRRTLNATEHSDSSVADNDEQESR